MSPQGALRGHEPHGTAEAASIEDKTLLIQTVAFTASVLPAFFVFLRILGRRIADFRIGPDDYLIIAALIPQCFYLAFLSSYGTRYGYGVHIWDAPPLALFALARTVFVVEIGYALTFTLIKLSMLCLFYRIFGGRPHAGLSIMLLTCLVLFWCLAVVGVTVSQCLPPGALWDRFHPDHPLENYRCRIEPTNFLALYFFSTFIIDFLTLLLPMPFLFKLRLQATHFYIILTYYIFSAVAVMISAAKVHYIRSWDSEKDDPTYKLVPLGVWMMADSGFSLISANWPFFLPALDKLVCGSASTTVSVLFRLLDRAFSINFLDRVLDRLGRPTRPVVQPDSGNAPGDSFEMTPASIQSSEMTPVSTQSSEMTPASYQPSAAYAMSRVSLISPLELPPPLDGQSAGREHRPARSESRSTSILEEGMDIALQWAEGSESQAGPTPEITEPPGSPASAGCGPPSRRSQREKESAERQVESVLSIELTEMPRRSD